MCIKGLVLSVKTSRIWNDLCFLGVLLIVFTLCVKREIGIVVSGNTIEKAKERFIEATSPKNIDKYRVKKKGGDKHTVEKIARDWLASKEGTIDPRTHRDYVMNCETRIIPVLGTRKISTITTNDLKQIIDSHQGRVIETLQTILKGIMNYAIANGEITFNPMQAIKFKKSKIIVRFIIPSSNSV